MVTMLLQTLTLFLFGPRITLVDLWISSSQYETDMRTKRLLRSLMAKITRRLVQNFPRIKVLSM
jgi:hypothetical protein